MSEADDRQGDSIEARSRLLFEAEVRGLDGRTRSKLAQARARAIEAAGSRQPAGWLTPPRLLPAGAVAAAVLAVLVLWQNPAAPPVPVETTVLNDLDLLLESEELDLLEELEFYAWLLEQPEFMEPADAVDDNG